jgi:hypothetical protein
MGITVRIDAMSKCEVRQPRERQATGESVSEVSALAPHRDAEPSGRKAERSEGGGGEHPGTETETGTEAGIATWWWR